MQEPGMGGMGGMGNMGNMGGSMGSMPATPVSPAPVHQVHHSQPPPNLNQHHDDEDDKKTRPRGLSAQIQAEMRKPAFVNNVLAVLFVCLFCFLLYANFSDGQLSFVFSFGEWIRSFGFVILMYKIHKQKTVAGLSSRALELYAVAFALRFLSTCTNEAYWPTDKTGDFYPVIPMFSLILTCVAIYNIRVTFKSTYDVTQDSFPHYYLVIVTFILAALLHLNYVNVFVDTAWAMSVYLESVSMFPQLNLLTKTRTVEGMTSHYIFFFGLDGVMKCIFWLSPFFYESPSWNYHDAVHTFIVCAQAVNTFLMGDFFYYYLKSLREGTPMVVPSFADTV
eukprot:GFYU01008974.1.p1 GENE.GFYU01008974.1~~GFYU01008974.1.p1  ORF type:complete len:336 (-),score=103.07 GFYU01008974.1:400-1407(-)